MEGKNLDEVPFVVLDFETTGLDPEAGDRICELGAMKLKGGRRGEVFWRLVDPGRPISLEALSVHHITRRMLEGAPSMGEVLPEFLRFLDDDVIVAYNASFEMKFLRSELGRAGLPPPSNIVVDVLSIARRLLPGLGNYGLGSVARRLGVEHTNVHRAMGDVSATVGVFLLLLDMARGRGLNTLGQLLGFLELRRYGNSGLAEGTYSTSEPHRQGGGGPEVPI
ncbi:MAG TPA: 3'-5' exonuclease [Candidatus Latescibacteria bacterium]|nr:3'-5' exonuclease [Candidatus Latescibacterota bacterium]